MKPAIHVSIRITCALNMCVIVLLAGSCQRASTPPNIGVHIRVIDDERLPVPESRVSLAGEKKVTDTDGRTHFEITATEGTPQIIRVDCPDGYRAIPSNTRQIIVHRLRSPQGKDLPMNESLLCIPQKKQHVVIVATNVSHPIPVLLNGTLVATLDHSGAAQFQVEGQTGDEIDVSFDTTHHPRLSPQMPSRLLKLPDKRRFFIFNQTFDTPPPVKPRVRKRTSSRRRGPVRL